jgi:protein-tyrosine phosphatase
MSDRVSVLFVCLGNICRSPTADAVLRQRIEGRGLAHLIAVDSCGTGGWHVGNSPDARAVAAGHSRGYDLSPLRARQVVNEDFERFDYILAMDEDNLAELEQIMPATFRGHLGLLLDFGDDSGPRSVPDPYYGGEDGFEAVLDMIETACDGLLDHIHGQATAR